MDSSILKAVGFVHLHVHSAFSLREGALSIEALAKLAKADSMPALAITDSNNLFGALEFSEKLAKSGVQPIIGAQLTVDFADAPASRLAPRRDAGRARAARLHRAGRSGLSRADAARLARLARPQGRRRAAYRLRCARRRRGPHRPHRRAGRADRPRAGARPRRCRRGAPETARPLFDGRLYVEIQRHGLESERTNEPALIDLAYAQGLPLVAANEPYFAGAADYEAQDALLCVAEGALVAAPERRRLSPEHRFKTRAEMLALFADLKEATENSVEIAMRCAYRPLTRKPILPRFSVPGGEAVDEEQELRRQASEGLERLIALYGCAPGHTRTTTASGSNSSSASSSE